MELWHLARVFDNKVPQLHPPQSLSSKSSLCSQCMRFVSLYLKLYGQSYQHLMILTCIIFIIVKVRKFL